MIHLTLTDSCESAPEGRVSQKSAARNFVVEIDLDPEAVEARRPSSRTSRQLTNLRRSRRKEFSARVSTTLRFPNSEKS